MVFMQASTVMPRTQKSPSGRSLEASRMVELGGDVRALIAQAQRLTQRSSGSPSTGHVLLAMLESRDDVSRLLETRGAVTSDT